MTYTELIRYLKGKESANFRFSKELKYMRFTVQATPFALVAFHEKKNVMTLELRNTPKAVRQLREMHPKRVKSAMNADPSVWYMVILDHDMEDELLLRLIDASYREALQLSHAAKLEIADNGQGTRPYSVCRLKIPDLSMMNDSARFRDFIANLGSIESEIEALPETELNDLSDMDGFRFLQFCDEKYKDLFETSSEELESLSEGESDK